MSASGPRLSLQHPPTYVPHTTPFSAPQTSASARRSASHPANDLDAFPENVDASIARYIGTNQSGQARALSLGWPGPDAQAGGE